jgi:hypothetical protein
MAQGDNTPIIARKLFISYHTVQNHKEISERKQILRLLRNLLLMLLNTIFCLFHDIVLIYCNNGSVTFLGKYRENIPAVR